MHVYMTETVGMMGLQEALGRVVSHPAGMDPHKWREQVADEAARAVADEWISLDMAHDMILVADMFVAEMLRYPQIIDWASDVYAEAAYHGYDPESAEAEIFGVRVPTPADQFIDDFLDSLIGKEVAHA